MSELYFDIGADTSLVNKALDGLKSKLDGVFKMAAKKLNIDADGSKASKLIDSIAGGTTLAVKNIDNLNVSFKNTSQEMDKVAGKTSIFEKAFNFNNLTNAVSTVSSAIGDVTDVGIQYESSLAAVGAITGLSGEKLDVLGGKARELAKQFGGSASDQLKSFQGVLSKLGPEIANDAGALELLSKNINTLSKASGDDAAASMEAITTAMLQMGLASGTPMEQAKNSSLVMNALAASAKVGAAEIPQVAEALKVAGVAAKGAGLDILETNTAIQVLAVGGKTGAEAGTALRNVLGLMQKATGPAEEALRKMGISSKQLGETLNSQGLPQALKLVNDGMNNFGSQAEKNAALMQIFGTENSAAAGVMLANLGKFDEFGKGIEAGVKAQDAEVQAAQRMATAEEQGKRIKAQIDDIKIGITNSLGETGVAFAQIGNEIAPLVTAFSGLASLIPFDSIGKFGATLANTLIPNLFITNAHTGALSFNMAALKSSTIGQTVATYAQIIAEKARLLATNASAVAMGILNAVMSANPVTLIVIGVAALTAGFVYLLSQMQPVQDAFKWTWEITKLLAAALWDELGAAIKFVYNVYATFYGAIWDGIKAIAKWIWNLQFVQNTVNGISKAFTWLKDTAMNVFNFISNLAKSVSDKLQSVAKALGFKEEPKVNVTADTKKAEEEVKTIPEKVGEVRIPVAAELLSDSFKALQDQFKKANEDNIGAANLVATVKAELKNSKDLDKALERTIKDSEQRNKIKLDIEAAGGLDNYAKSFEKLAKQNSKEQYKLDVINAKNAEKLNTESIKKNLALKQIALIDEQALQLKLNREAIIDEGQRKRKEIYDNSAIEKAKLLANFNSTKKLTADLIKYEEDLKKILNKEDDQIAEENRKQREKELSDIVKATETSEKLKFDIIKTNVEALSDIYKQGYLTETLLEEKKLADLKLINANKEKSTLDFIKGTEKYKDSLSNLQIQFKAGKIDENEYKTQVNELIQTLSKSFTDGSDDLSKAFQLVFTQANNAANKAIGDTTNQYYADKQTLALAQITDLAILEREMSILEAEKTFKELTAKANGNRVLEKNAYEAFLIAKFEAEEKYKNNTMSSMDKFIISVVDSMRSAFSNVSFDFSVSQDNESKRKATEDLKAQEKELKQSLKSNEITYEDYVSKLNDLDKQREEQVGKSVNKLQDFWNTYNSFLSNIFKTMVDNNQKMIDETLKARNDNQKKVISIEKEQSENTDKLSAEYFKLEQAKNEASKEATEQTSQYYALMGANIGASLADAFVNGKNLAEELPKILLDSLLKMIPVYIAEIYASQIASDPFTGILKAAGWTALLMGLVGSARAAVGAEDGVIGITKSYNKKAGKSDSIPLMVAPGESIIKASVTSKYGDLLNHLNKGGELATFSTYKLIQQPRININNDNLVTEIRGLKAEIKALKGNINKVESVQNVNVKTDIPKRINVVLQSNLHRG